MFPLSVGIAVLRFHLYDLDVVVRKTLIYGAFALFATLIYLGLVVGVGAWLGQGNSFLTMVAAVVVALTFQPARVRLTRFANRVVYGERATPYEVLSEFSERVGGAYADEDVLPRMARILGEGIGADRADVWLAVDQELRDVAAWPGDVDRLAPIALPNGSVPAIPGVDRVYPVESAGELLGALAIRKPASDPVTPSDEKLIADLAGQAGLVLRNVRLNEELKLRFDELKAAQKRLVSAQDEGRRRLERNIHDGAQQQLVALAVKLRLADNLIERDPTKAHELLEQIQPETHAALEDLRDLARGIYPPLLADKGLRRRARGAGPQERSAGHAPGGRRRSLPAGGRGRRVLLVPRGAAERGEVRRGVRGRHHAGRPRRTHLVHRRRRRPGLRSERAPERHGPAGDRGPARRARRTVHGHVVARTRDDARGIAPRGRAGDGVRVSGRATKKPKGLRRVERWMVGLAMGVIAFVLEKAVMRSVRKGGGSTPAPEPTTITSKGAEADLTSPTPAASGRSMAIMERVTGIGGVFQRAGQAASLRDWYAEHLGIDIADWGGKPFEWTPGGSTTWAVFDHDTEYFGRPEQAYMVNFRVADLDAMLAQLRSAGVEVIDALDESELGRFGWAVDPEGTRFELWEPPPGG